MKFLQLHNVIFLFVVSCSANSVRTNKRAGSIDIDELVSDHLELVRKLMGPKVLNLDPAELPTIKQEFHRFLNPVENIVLTNGVLSGLSNVAEVRNFIFGFDKNSSEPHVSGTVVYKSLNGAFDYQADIQVIKHFGSPVQDSGKITLDLSEVTATLSAYANMTSWEISDATIRDLQIGGVSVAEMRSEKHLDKVKPFVTIILKDLIEPLTNPIEESLNKLVEKTLIRINKDRMIEHAPIHLLDYYELEGSCDHLSADEIQNGSSLNCDGLALKRRKRVNNNLREVF